MNVLINYGIRLYILVGLLSFDQAVCDVTQVFPTILKFLNTYNDIGIKNIIWIYNPIFTNVDDGKNDPCTEKLVSAVDENTSVQHLQIDQSQDYLIMLERALTIDRSSLIIVCDNGYLAVLENVLKKMHV